MFRFEGDKFITKVDVAWSEWWVGTEQTRFFKLEGNRLKIISQWGPNNMPHLGLGKTIRAILTWEPVK
ncbi:MAG: lipocalin-like domain-containing protein [Deltaproteobacteria bacterium]|nr:lipocalin-like domain-containing protein [Deltaproteobacteria bacterium]